MLSTVSRLRLFALSAGAVAALATTSYAQSPERVQVVLGEHIGGVRIGMTLPMVRQLVGSLRLAPLQTPRSLTWIAGPLTIRVARSGHVDQVRVSIHTLPRGTSLVVNNQLLMARTRLSQLAPRYPSCTNTEDPTDHHALVVCTGPSGVTRFEQGPDHVGLLVLTLSAR
ncbi:MAG: hypothetical protein Q8Q09_25625 [Deltaproteobacteria bacterium]|nr:hypothetical protein [Deltaproteobacteria bacterium]